MSLRSDVADWLGDFAAEVSEEQGEQLERAFDEIEARWPDQDQADDRTEAASAATQIILGDDTLEAIAGQWHEARRVERARMAALTGALLASSGSERELSERTRVARMTVRKALGR
ncbi:hypothetical protein Ae717Ps2_6242c [Pseudonocardia sp. Ae717_Ps2]|uniref:hypothetical protein n=1 Tax=Pseudonocardia sp. Ae717_Ps2 TaxID=1885573 RepID=UPI00094AC33D|nr:hypothetical protein [Pseudonocardia sp. Ae717_Ps2]OLM28646.1 hypothetical protein Ae717Ps2_6242c [Pseudonocardia sp. Ae717_Ps2]